MKKKALSLLLTVAMLLSLISGLGTAAGALDAVSYLSPVYNTTGEPTSGLARMETLSCSDYTEITSENKPTTLEAGWYVVSGTVDYGTSAITVSGDVHLILKDDASLTVSGGNSSAGVRVSGDSNALTIYGQANNTGALTANGGDGAAAIGGDMYNGGNNITINGGTVTANAGGGGAGIGSGCDRGTGKNIVINGGIVVAKGGGSGAGIGGGWTRSPNAENIVINGGNVYAESGVNNDTEWGSPIGSGMVWYSPYTTGVTGSGIKIASNMEIYTGMTADNMNEIENDANLVTNLDKCNAKYAEVITSYAYYDEHGVRKLIPIENTTAVTETDTMWGQDGEDTWYVVKGDVTIETLDIIGNVHLILKNGAKLTVTGDTSAPESIDEILTPNGGWSGEGILISYGGSLTIYASSTATAGMGKLIVNGAPCYAAIGDSGSGSVTIAGGIVEATGGTSDDSSLSGGDGIKVTTISITGGKVTATGGDGHRSGDGGNGLNAVSGDISVTGGVVYTEGGAGGTDGYNQGSNGAGMKAKSEKTITIADSLTVLAGDNSADTKVENNGGDLRAALSDKRYVAALIPVCTVTTGGTTPVTTYYASVEEGLNAWVDGSTLKLLVDYTLTDNIYVESYETKGLDLNDHILTGNGSGCVIVNDGTLTVTDTSETKTTRYLIDNKCEHGTTIGEYCNSAWQYAQRDGNFETMEATYDTTDKTEGVEYIKVIGGCITGGNNTTDQGVGGGIQNNGELTVTGCNIVSNHAFRGGGVHNNGTATLNNVCIYNNTSPLGAGVHNAYYNTGLFTLNNCVIKYNHATGQNNDEGTEGGGILNCYENGQMVINGCTIENNSSDIFGGGVCNYGNLTISGNTTITGNTAESYGDNTLIFSNAEYKKLTVGTPGPNMNVGVTLLRYDYDEGAGEDIYSLVGGAFTTEAQTNIKAYEKYFFADNNIFNVAYNAGTGSGAYLELAISEAYKWYYNDITASTFTISNIDELEALAVIVNNGTSFYDCTVTLSDNFTNTKSDGTTPAALTTPIGTGNKRFDGTFDGNGKTVELNIKSDDYKKHYVGMFGSALYATIQNVNTSGTIDITSTSGATVGGLVGYVVDGTIKNCSSDCDIKVKATYASVGGLVGEICRCDIDTKIINCYTTGAVEVTSTADCEYADAGGVVGYNEYAYVINCYASGSLKAVATGEYGEAYIGGVCAECYEGSFFNCYYKTGIADKAVGINYDADVSCCYALPDSQMKAGAKVQKPEEETWVKIAISNSSSPEYEAEKSLTDALNGYLSNSDDSTLRSWGVMNSSVNGNYPIFAMNDTLVLCGGKAYTTYYTEQNNEPTAMPEGISYKDGIYTFENVNLAAIGDNYLKFKDASAKIELKGDNQIGVVALTDCLASGTDYYPVHAHKAIEGAALTFTGTGSLLIYDEMDGIVASNTLTFDKNFTGTVTVNDHGAQQAFCALEGYNGVTIENGTFNLSNRFSSGIKSHGTVAISGETTVINVKGGEAAVGAGILTIAEPLLVTGANENYTAGTVNSLTNKEGTEYVTIKAYPVTVSFDAQNDTAVTAVTAYQSVTVAKPATEPVKSEYTFGGWYTDAACTNAWNFANDKVAENMTLYAKWIENSESKAVITGTVTDSADPANPIEGAVVELWLGTDKVAAAKTNAAGEYTFDNVENGLYNIVVIKDSKTKTAIVNVNSVNTYIVDPIAMPSGDVNSKVYVKENTSATATKADVSSTVVGGVDSVAEEETPDPGQKITILLTVEPKEENTSNAEQTEIKTAAGSKTVEFVDLTLTKQIDDGAKNDIGSTNTKVLTITLPFDTTDVEVSSITVYRHHDTAAALISESEPMAIPADGHFYVDAENNLIYIYASQFSTYAIGYNKTTKGVTVTSIHKANTEEDGTCPQDSTCVYAKYTDSDTKAWYHDGVHFCVENSYMVGISADEFAPDGTLSRAMIVTMLWRMEGSPVANYAMSFEDVDEDLWYTEAIRWAQSTGVVKGYNDVSFGPNDDVTREQLAAILMRYAAFKGIDVSTRADLAGFTDADTISDWALENVQWANAVAMIQGRTDTTIVPTGTATRAEAACMIQRFCENVIK